MQVRCVDNSYFKSVLTVGKWYEVERQDEHFYYITNDDGDNDCPYSKDSFLGELDEQERQLVQSYRDRLNLKPTWDSEDYDLDTLLSIIENRKVFKAE